MEMYTIPTLENLISFLCDVMKQYKVKMCWCNEDTIRWRCADVMKHHKVEMCMLV